MCSPDDEQPRERSFADRAGHPFPSYGDVTYVVRVDSNGKVRLSYSDGRTEEAWGLSAEKVLKFARNGTWKEVTE